MKEPKYDVVNAVRCLLKKHAELSEDNPCGISGESMTWYLLKDGCLITLQVEDAPDEEVLENIFGDKMTLCQE